MDRRNDNDYYYNRGGDRFGGGSRSGGGGGDGGGYNHYHRNQQDRRLGRDDWPDRQYGCRDGGGRSGGGGGDGDRYYHYQQERRLGRDDWPDRQYGGGDGGGYRHYQRNEQDRRLGRGDWPDREYSNRNPPRPVHDNGGPEGSGENKRARIREPAPQDAGDEFNRQAQLQTQIPATQHVSGIRSLQDSEKQQSLASSLQDGTENDKRPITRPDRGGQVASRRVGLLVNHFPVNFNPANTLMHYDVEIKQENTIQSQFVKKIPKHVLALIREKLCTDNPDEFPLQMTAYDGEKSIFSAIPLPTGSFNVQLSDKCYVLSIKLVNVVKLSKLKDYLRGNLVDRPGDVLQGMNIVMKEHSLCHKIPIGRGMYSRVYRPKNDLNCGIAAYRGSEQSLKPTCQGLVLCLDYSVIALRKQMPVLEFLVEHIQGFRGVGDVTRLRKEVLRALTGVKVKVTHRRSNQKYTIVGLTDRNTRDVSFDDEDPESKEKPRKLFLLDYFREKYGMDIVHKDIPCLDVSKSKKRPNYLPMEYCILADDKQFPKERLDRNAGVLLKNLSLIPPNERKREICEMVEEEHGPHGGDITRNFQFEVDKYMTRVQGRVIPPPNLRLGGRMSTTVVDKVKCHWNLVGKSVVDGKRAARWALIDFSSQDRRFGLNQERFIPKLIRRCSDVGIRMERPLVVRSSGMRELSDVYKLEMFFESIMREASGKSNGGRLQIIICAMCEKDDAYKNIKWVSETKIGVVTQCFLTSVANKGNDRFLDQYLANLALKINAKLGGTNAELIEQLPLLDHNGDHFMFIGADVNHPASSNKTSPSIVAVVGSVNWPAATRYAARVAPQKHRKEEIANFGGMCLELVNTYARMNGVRPNKIVIFRDGVSEEQFGMVLNIELQDLKHVFSKENYFPTITVVVARKRHLTRLFLENERDGVPPGNIPPGTVVDSTIVHPFEFDFFLCSHFGGIGTSRATYYTVIWDEHGYSSDQIQKLIYDLCFTYARCTKPASLVPPVYYADLVAYRGRMFQEAAEQQSPAASAGIYKLHPELENFMFFV